jgi:hypothetical protein
LLLSAVLLLSVGAFAAVAAESTGTITEVQGTKLLIAPDPGWKPKSGNRVKGFVEVEVEVLP